MIHLTHRPHLLALALSASLLSACDSSYTFADNPGEQTPVSAPTPDAEATPTPSTPSTPDNPGTPLDPGLPADPADPGNPAVPGAPPAPMDPGSAPAPGVPVDPTPPPAPSFPEPASARWDELDVGGFYDVDASGKPRAVRNDLAGNLPAMIQFAQSHTVDPSGNEARNMPRLTSERAALLLVTPEPSLGAVESMRVVVSVNGKAMGTLQMLHPNAMYRSDNTTSNNRRDYNYSRRAFSVHLPWDWVVPGMSLAVSDDQGRSGSLAASAIEFGAPGELVVQSIRMGMLTAPNGQSNEHWFLAQPEQAAADYFQTIPAAKLTVGYYEPMQLDRVMVASGVIYDINSPDPALRKSASEGGVYGGDMRENVGKSTVSVGTNLANFGLSSSGMQSQNQPQLFQHVLAHHNVGEYANGRQSHGLSGGNGMLTLYSSRGNEFSHEIGHHYGLGHFPGQNGANYFWAGHHHDSGWGYISYRKRMRANLHWNRAKNGGMGGMPVFEDLYSFGTDAMSGGHYATSLSNYTHYTGYSTKIRIQPALDRVMPDPGSATGWSKWNAQTRQMEDNSPSTGTSGVVNMNLPGNRYLKPRLTGAPVFTLLGGYDPDTGKALLYPPFRGNWGMVYDLPAPAATATARQCWVEVTFANGSRRQIELAGRRMQANLVNKLHINLAQADNPRQATVNCKEPGAAAVVLDTVTFAQNLPAMPAPVVVGKQHGYAALRRVELPQLEAAMQAVASQPVIRLNAQQELLVASWGEDSSGLSTSARGTLQRYQQQQDRAMRINRWMNRYRSALEAGNNADASAALSRFIDAQGMRQTPFLPTGMPVRLAGARHCLKAEQVNGVAQVYIATSGSCTGAVHERWNANVQGLIASAAYPELCLTTPGGNGGAVTLATCDSSAPSQVFELALPSIKRGGACMEMRGGRMSNGRGQVSTYGCNGTPAQQWAGLSTSDNQLFSLLSTRNLRLLRQLDLE